MTLVKNPFLSKSARGIFANQLTAFSHAGKSHIILKRQRRGLFAGLMAGLGRIYLGGSFLGFSGMMSEKTKKQEQGAQRLVFKNAWLAYALLTNEQKKALANEARFLSITGPNLFMSRYYSI